MMQLIPGHSDALCFLGAHVCIFYFHASPQGEDVSMGIWMAAVGPKRYQVSLKELSDLTEREYACSSK